MKKPLTEAQEVAAKELAAAIAEATAQEIQKMADTLVGSDAPFGQTEIAIRDIVLRDGAKAYEHYLAQKNTATKDPA
jgi:hypothetical protein